LLDQSERVSRVLAQQAPYMAEQHEAMRLVAPALYSLFDHRAHVVEVSAAVEQCLGTIAQHKAVVGLDPQSEVRMVQRGLTFLRAGGKCHRDSPQRIDCRQQRMSHGEVGVHLESALERVDRLAQGFAATTECQQSLGTL